MNKSAFLLCILFLGGVFITACTTEFEVYAPEKEIHAVYCVLNPRQDVQYLRIARVYQVEGDALEYAKNNDLSLKNKLITLSGSNGTEYTGVAIDSFPKDNDGLFYPYQTIYTFITDGVLGPKLVEDVVYTLKVGTDDAPDFLTASTRIPRASLIQSPSQPVGGQGGLKCLQALNLDKVFEMKYKAYRDVAYEIRISLDYEKNGVPQPTAIRGPGQLIQSDLFKLNPSLESSFLTERFAENELIWHFSQYFPKLPNTVYTYNTTDSCTFDTSLYRLPKSFKWEVTAVDSGLTNYMNVNNPKYVDFTGAKPEYTNIRGKIEAIGILGSINTSEQYAILRPCSEYLLGLNGTPKPPGCD